MRKILISLLLASAAASPAIAGSRDWSDRQQVQDNRQQAQDNRQQARQERVQARDDARAQRSAERPQFNGGARFQQSFNDQPNAYAAQRNAYAAQRGAYTQGEGYARQRQAYAAQRDAYAAQREAYAQQRNAYAGQRNTYAGQRDYRGAGGQQPYVMRERNGQVGNMARPGMQPPMGDNRRVAEMNWNRNWRNDGHYDWRDYREQHRSRFHLGLYMDPFGWGYQSFGIGWRMWPAYYGNQFWIDPSMYELPYPPPGCAWVRYWNDAVLVDTYSGTVLDVIPGFFW